MSLPIGMLPLDQETGTYNLTTPAVTGPVVLTHTPDTFGSRNCRVVLIVGGLSANQLSGNGGDYTLTINSNGVPWNAGEQTHTLGTAARAMIVSEAFTSLPNLPVTVQLLSPNGTETAVDVDAYLFDIDGNAIAATHDAQALQQSGTPEAQQGRIIYVAPNSFDADSWANGHRGRWQDPLAKVQDAIDNAVTDGAGDTIILVGKGPLAEAVNVNKANLSIRGPGTDFLWNEMTGADVITINAEDCHLSGFRLETHTAGFAIGINAISANGLRINSVSITHSQSYAISISAPTRGVVIEDCFLADTSVTAGGHGIQFFAANDTTVYDMIVRRCQFHRVNGDAILCNTAGTGVVQDAVIEDNVILNSTEHGVNFNSDQVQQCTIARNVIGGSGTADIRDIGTGTVIENNEQWAKAGTTLVSLDDLENLSSADVMTQLEAIKLHYLVNEAPAGPGLIADGTVLADMADIGGTWSNFDRALHSLRAIRSRGDAAWTTADQTIVDAALEAIGLHWLVSEALPGAALVADNSIIAQLADPGSTYTNYDPADHSLRALRLRGDAAWVTADPATVAAGVFAYEIDTRTFEDIIAAHKIYGWGLTDVADLGNTARVDFKRESDGQVVLSVTTDTTPGALEGKRTAVVWNP